MPKLLYTEGDRVPFYAPDDDADAPGDGTALEKVVPVADPQDDAFIAAARRLYGSVKSKAREGKGGKLLDLLAGGNPEVERFQTWPERMVRSAVTLPYDAMMGRVPNTEAVLEPNALATFLGADPKSTWSVPAPESMIGRVQDLAGMAVGGPLTAPRGGATLRSGLERPDIGGAAMKNKSSFTDKDGYTSTVVHDPHTFVNMYGEEIPVAGRMYITDPAGKMVEVPGKWMDFPEKDWKHGGVNLWKDYYRPNKPGEVRKSDQYPTFADWVKDNTVYGRLPVEQRAAMEARQQATAYEPLSKQFQEGTPTTTLMAEGGRVAAPLAGLKEPAPVFYSAVEHAISNARQQSASPDQWLGFLRNQPGVKAEELQWMGLDDWLKDQKGPVRKEQIDEFVKNNKVEIKEIRKEGDRISEYDEEEIWRRAYRENPRRRGENEEVWRNRVQEAASEAVGYENMVGGGTSYSEYQLPGGENYRELLLTLPQQRVNVQEAERFLRGEMNKDPRPYHPTDEAIVREATKRGFQGDRASNYTTSHWDEPNVLAHVRVNDRMMGGQINDRSLLEGVARYPNRETGPNWEVWDNKGQRHIVDSQAEAAQIAALNSPQTGGARTLFLEEVQSDWHQAGRKQGYRNPKPLAAKEEIELRQLGEMTFRQREEAGKGERYAELKDRNNKQGVPDAPFKTTWPDLVLKRMVREAAENGYDQIAWTPGEVQAARYDLSKQISKIEHHDFAGSGQRGITAYDHSGNKVIDRYVKDDAELAALIGKEAAERLMKAEETKGSGGSPIRTLEGVDLKVGGEGMKAFYDKMLVDKANALGKKFGAKVERQPLEEVGSSYATGPNNVWYPTDASGVRIEGPLYRLEADVSKMHVNEVGPDGTFKKRAGTFEDGQAAKEWIQKQIEPQHVWVMKITPRMREAAVGKGFPLFSAGLPFQFERVDHDPFATQYQSPLFRTEPVDHDPFGVLPYDPNRT